MLAIGNKTDGRPLVYFVGLSAKPMCEHLDPETRTGTIIERIIHELPAIETVKTNLVKIPPIDQKGNLRYPNQTEMQSGWNQLRHEIDKTFPTIIVTLGQQVSFFLRSQMGIHPAKPRLPSDFSYESYLLSSQFNILSVHHPSFIYVYRRKDIVKYVENVVKSIVAPTFEGNCYAAKTYSSYWHCTNNH
jgi:uracil-DNA glycosylase